LVHNVINRIKTRICETAEEKLSVRNDFQNIRMHYKPPISCSAVRIHFEQSELEKIVFVIALRCLYVLSHMAGAGCGLVCCVVIFQQLFVRWTT
jgi:hypothetical protein